MKKTLLLLSLSLGALASLQAQGIKNPFKKDSSGSRMVDRVIKPSNGASSLSTDEVARGLKAALEKGAEQAISTLSVSDGFFKNAAVKVLMPAEAKKVETRLRALKMDKLVDDAIESMNRAAEDAAGKATPIFLDAIKGMSFADAMAILRGGDVAATQYLKDKTTASLTTAFKPVIEASLKKVNATQYWNAVFTNYNRVSREKVNPDLVAYVTEKALAGIFHQVGLEEQKIRKDPAARTTELLKKVFAQ